MAITTARYWKDGDKLSFGVSSPLVKAAVSAKMEEKGVFADVSLSGNILRVDPGRFGEVLASLISKSQADRVVGLLKDKKLLDEKTLKTALGKKGGELATKFIEQVSDAAAKKGFDALVVGLGAALGGPAGAGAAAGAVAIKNLSNALLSE